MYDKKLVADYLIKKTEEIRNLKFFEREIEIDFIPGKAISIIGPRRSGKSFLLKILGKKFFRRQFYVDFENIEVKKVEAAEVFELIALYTEIFGEEPDILLLDEIENLKDWSSLVRSLLDRGFKILISGSSSKLSSKEIATQLRGRTISYILLPLSFREFLNLKGFAIKKYLSLEEEAKAKRLLREYLLEGSYPEVLLAENEERKRRILSDYYTTILYRDFVERFELKSLEVAKFIFDFFLQNYSCLFSVKKVANFLASQGVKFGKSTIYSYVEKLPETLSIFFVEKFGSSIYERMAWPKKSYVCDLGLSNVVKFSEDFGRRMENTVFLEFQRKINKNPLLNVFFFRNKKQNEVDFVVKENLMVKQLVQVSYASSKDEIERREIKSLIKAGEELNCKNLLIITWDYEDELKINEKTIKCMPLWKWLLVNEI